MPKPSLRQRLLVKLLHYANASPSPVMRNDFYELKNRLLRRYGRFDGHDLQEIRKECYGTRDHMGDWSGCQGEKCRRCNGTGIFDIRWVRLERWAWCGYVFHRPSGDTRVPPAIGTVRIFGRIEHPDYGLKSREAALWLYLLCGEWKLFLRASSVAASAYPRCWPLLRVQSVAFWCRMNLSWRKCWCGRWYPEWGSGWQICRKCRKPKHEEEVPF